MKNSILLAFVLSVPVFTFLTWNSHTDEVDSPQNVEEAIISSVASPPPCNCTLTQGSFSSPLPFMSTNSSAVNFYAYGNPVGASANTGLEISETLLVMLHEDTNTGNTSLIVILDEGPDATGGNVDMTINCLPDSAAIALQDDNGEMSGAPPIITGAFNWATCCTDGGVISGVGCGNTITINPTINSGINDFSLVYGTPGNPIYINMPDIQCPITINCGGTSCCDDAFDFSASTQNPSCEDSPDGAIDLTTDCATNPTFLWSTGAVTEDISNLLPGDYSVTITDENGCSATSDYSLVPSSTAPTPTITGPTQFCEGESITLGLSETYSSYIWSTNSSSPTIPVFNPGVYSVTVTNAFGCTGSDSFFVTENPVPITDDYGEYCQGTIYDYPGNGQSYTEGDYIITYPMGTSLGCDSIVNLHVTENPIYLIDVYHTICEGEVIIVDGVPYTNPGSYNINLTTQNTGCDSTIFLDITVLNPISTIEDPPELNCLEDEAIIFGFNSVGDQYSWSSPNGGTICAGQNTPVITVCAPGTYCLEMTMFGFDIETNQSVSCTDESCVTVVQNADTPVLDGNGTDVSCGGSEDGIAFVEVTSGGEEPFIYIWNSNPQQVTQTATDLPAGTYTVTVTGANGCTQDFSVVINEPDSIVLEPSSVATACNGDSTGTASVSASGGNPGYTYEWNTNPVQVTQTAVDLPAGSYSVTVTDANGCTNEESVLVESPDPISVSVSGENIACNGDESGSVTATGTGGSGSYMYEWDSNPIQETATATNLPIGDYTVVITDENGCTATNSISLTEAEPIELSISSIDALCNGSEDGSATVTATGGTGMLAYEWDTAPPQVNETAENISAGDYTVIVTDENGCSEEISIQVNEPDPINLSTDQVDVLCTGDPTGEATVMVSGGITPYSYLWDDNAAQNTATATGLEANTYAVIVTDANDCTATISVTIEEPDEALSASGTSTDALCGQSNGAIDVTVTGGTIPYNYDWNGAAGNEQDPTGLGPGVYTVVITDANGCTTSISVTVDSPDSPSAIVEITDANCNGESNGVMDITVSGGIAPYDYTWEPSANNGNEDLSNVGAGTYSVTITDQVGCTTIANGVINEPDVLEASSTPSPADCGIDNGSISVVVSGGTGDYDFDWPGTVNDGVQSPEDLAIGTYEVTITDENGCTITTSSEIIVPGGPSTSFVSTDALCNGDASGTIDLTITDGTTPYVIDWGDPNLDGNEDIANLPAGDYQVIITDANNCSTTELITIEEPEELLINTSTTALTCFGSNDGTATATPTGGTAPYSFDWCDGQNAQTAVDCVPGPCTVVIVDANGCSAEATVVIDEPEELLGDALPLDALCNGELSGEIDVSVTGGVGPYIYNWNKGLPEGEDQVDVGAGDYVVIITDANGCTFEITSILVGEPDEITTSFITTDATCNEANGTIDLTVTGGTAPYTFNWSGGLPDEEDPSAVGTGSYDVIVTDANGCTAIGSTVVNTPDALSISAAPQDVDCNGASTGNIDVTISGGTPPLTFQWNDVNQQITEDAIGLPAGDYTLLVTDSNGCTISVNASVFEPTDIQLSATSTDATCNQSNGTIDLTVIGGTPPYVFDWSGTAPDIEDPNGLVTGSYDVTVTDANNCTAVLTQAVNTPSGLSVDAIGSPVDCFGNSTGAVDLQVSGGTPPFTYQWDDQNAQTIEDPVGLLAGNYNVVVTDGDGCTIVASATVTQPDELEASGVSTEAFCSEANGSIDLTVIGGVEPYVFDWNGSTPDVEDPADLFSGVYDVVITDANGCTVSATVEITEPDPLELSAIQNDALCNGESSGSVDLIVSGGTLPYNYQWDDANNQTIEDPINLLAGDYNVLVTDANGCTITTNAQVGEPEVLEAGFISDDATCGDANGSIDLTVTGGTAPYTFDWSGAIPDEEDPQGVPAGTFSVTVTDNQGCTLVTSAIVNTPSELTASSVPVDALCNGDPSGIIDLTITGGTAPYDIQWNGGLGTDEDPVDVSAGDYTATITDDNGCQITVDASVGEPMALAANSTSMQATCGEANGSIDLTVSGGTAPYIYLWDGGASPVEDPQNISTGIYNVTITDANNCTLIYTENVSTPPALALSTNNQDVSCNDSTDGSIDITVSGGTAPFSYQWDDPQNSTTEDLIDIGAGDYTIIVSDANGCTITASVMVDEPAILIAENNAPTNVSCNGGNDGSALIIVNGGTPGYSFDWSDNSFDGQDEPIAMSAGTYSVTVTDMNGCTATEEVTILEPDALQLDISATSAQCYGNSDGTVNLSVIGGTAPYTYDWNNGVFDTEDLQNIGAGNYSVVVTDNNGCIETISIIVDQPSALNVTVDEVSNYGGVNITCDDATDGYASVVGSGGTAPYSFTWNTGATADFIENLSVGSYVVTLTDANGCTATTVVDLEGPPALSLNLEITDPDCFGYDNGTIIATGSGGVGPYLYALENQIFSTVNLFNNLSSGSYQIIAQDANGCETVLNASVVDPPELTVDLGEDMLIQMGDSVQLDPILNVPDFTLDSFIWARNEITELYPWVSPLQNSNYHITVINQNDCIAEDEILVRVKKDRLIYIPNAFSPNDDGLNDLFMIYGGTGVKEVKTFRIFNRWGEILFEGLNFQPEDPDFGWNGRFKDEVLNPAVFVYLAEIEFLDGEIRIFKGDVTLMK